MRIFGLGGPELLLILFICFLIFGAKKLPEMGRSIGKTFKEIKKGLKDASLEDDSEEKS